jgi:hypothetical protein
VDWVKKGVVGLISVILFTGCTDQTVHAPGHAPKKGDSSFNQSGPFHLNIEAYIENSRLAVHGMLVNDQGNGPDAAKSRGTLTFKVNGVEKTFHSKANQNGPVRFSAKEILNTQGYQAGQHMDIKVEYDGIAGGEKVTVTGKKKFTVPGILMNTRCTEDKITIDGKLVGVPGDQTGFWTFFINSPDGDDPIEGPRLEKKKVLKDISGMQHQITLDRLREEKFSVGIWYRKDRLALDRTPYNPKYEVNQWLDKRCQKTSPPPQPEGIE